MDSPSLTTALLAVMVIIAVAQWLGAAAERIGQPRGMDDIVAGSCSDRARWALCRPS